MRQDVKTESHDRVGCNNEGQQSQLMELLESEVARRARCKVVPCASCQHDYQIFYFLFLSHHALSSPIIFIFIRFTEPL
jgi:hypothetical protein